VKRVGLDKGNDRIAQSSYADLYQNTKENNVSLEDKIRQYILENFLFTDDASALDSNDSFLEQGILDSTGILEVIMFLEEEFDVKVQEDEMIPENLDSVLNLVNFVKRKQAE